MAIRVMTLLIIALVAAGWTVAQASGLVMATEWTWTRDGARIFNSLVVIGAIAWIIVKYGGPILKNRAQMITERFESIEQARIKAENSLKEYEEKIKRLEAETVKIRAEAKAEGEMIKKKVVEQATMAAEMVVEKATERILLESKQAGERLKAEATFEAVRLAEQIINKNIRPDDQKKFVTEYIASLGKTN